MVRQRFANIVRGQGREASKSPEGGGTNAGVGVGQAKARTNCVAGMPCESGGFSSTGSGIGFGHISTVPMLPNGPRFPVVKCDARRVRRPTPYWIRRSTSAFGVGIFAVLLLVGANQAATLPYYVIRPGSIQGVGDFAEVPPGRSYPPEGEMFLTTVSLVEARPFDILRAKLSRGHRIEKERDVLGDTSEEQYFDVNERMMAESQETALAIAMRRAGYSVTQRGDGAEVRGISEGSPAEGRLAEGEVIVGAEGQPVQLSSELGDIVRPLGAGTAVTLDVVASDGARRSVEITLALRPGGEGSYVGVLLGTKNARLDTPFPVTRAKTEIGGPSAGLAFTLALLDELTPGELTGEGGRKVAVTGEVDLDGTVGRVGGIEQKALAVSRSDARLFLVPSAEVDEARRFGDDDIEVVGVDTVDQAVDALRERGGQLGEPLPVPPG